MTLVSCFRRSHDLALDERPLRHPSGAHRSQLSGVRHVTLAKRRNAFTLPLATSARGALIR